MLGKVVFNTIPITNYSDAYSLVEIEDFPKSQRECTDIAIKKLLNEARFSVYLVYSSSEKRDYALKVFGSYHRESKHCFRNEARFASLNHPNIIKIIKAKENTQIEKNNINIKASYILMEYAQYGDFYDLIESKKELNEKVVRTYFIQLIRGLEFLHKKGVWHLDLKLENLLLGENYQLKIADFDLSYMKGDASILSRGTRYFRAPELRAGMCTNGAAADIYAAGSVLFALKTSGVIPHTEEDSYKGVNLYQLLNTNSYEFFKKHCFFQKRDQSLL